MSHIHLYHPLEIQYEATAYPQFDESVITCFREAFKQFPNIPVQEDLKLDYVSYIFSKPIKLAEKSRLLVKLLYLLDKFGWEVVSGVNIHNQEGMVFRKKQNKLLSRTETASQTEGYTL